MAILKYKEIKKLSDEEISKKLEELKIELVKSNAQKSSQGAAIKTKEIKKAIARILTHRRANKK